MTWKKTIGKVYTGSGQPCTMEPFVNLVNGRNLF